MAGATKLLTASGGGVTLTPASNIASDVTVNVPSVNGTAVVTSSAVSAAGQIPFSTDGSTFTPTAKIVAGTSVTASGTSIDFTGIPSWVKRITVMFRGVSTNGISTLLIQIGDSGGIETTSYSSIGGYIQNAGSSGMLTSAAGYIVPSGNSTNSLIATYTINLVNPPTNSWIIDGSGALESALAVFFTNGLKSLSDTLDRVRITTSNGTDTFDAGSINILYE